VSTGSDKDSNRGTANPGWESQLKQELPMVAALRKPGDTTGFSFATAIVLNLPKGPVPVRAWVDSCADTDFISQRFLLENGYHVDGDMLAPCKLLMEPRLLALE
jgi:hypothetical protein